MQPDSKVYYKTTLSDPRKYVVFLSLFVLIFLAITAFFTQKGVRKALNRKLEHDLTTILNAEMAALDLWKKNEEMNVEMWAQTPQVEKAIEQLIEITHSEKNFQSSIIESKAIKDLRATLQPISIDYDYLSYLVVDKEGRIIATQGDDTIIGQQVSPQCMAMSFQVLRGDTLFLMPTRMDFFFENMEGFSNKPFIVIASPVRGKDDKVIAALVSRIDPEEDFSRILSMAQTGETGHIYLFDKQGNIISSIRFEDQLRELELIPDTPDESAILNVQVRDPGVNLLTGKRPDLPIGARPFTKMAASALSGESGMDLDGYRDFRGVKVIGAWRWIPKVNIGIAVEIEFYESFKLLIPLVRAFVALFVILVIVCAVVVLSTYNIQLLKRRIKEVQRLGKYTLLEKIGEGGIGVVYKARHAMLQRPIAIKTLKPDTVSLETITRFEREVQLTSLLTHPNTIEIYDFGRTNSGVFYYVMEYLPGINLGELISIDTKICAARVVNILKQICRSLEEAHSIGLVHRDIKPLNIILCQRGKEYDFIKVLDFGLIKDLGMKGNSFHTATNVIQGTPQYIAPELLSNPRNIDSRSDIYSLGVVAFNLLTGQDLYDISSPAELFDKVLNLKPQAPSERGATDIPPALDELVLKCIAKNPAERPQNITEIIEILEQIQCTVPWTQKQAREWWSINLNKINSKLNKQLVDDTTLDATFLNVEK